MSGESVTIAEVLGAARAGRASLSPESAGYLSLALADLLAREPRVIAPATASLSEEGTATVSSSAPRAATSDDADRAARALLRDLLSVASGNAPALGAASTRAGGEGIGALVAELEAALIPVNRGAARRALARLARETLRAREDGAIAAAPTPAPVAAPAPPPNAVPSLPTPEPPPADDDTIRIEVAPQHELPPVGARPPHEPETASPPADRADELLASFSTSAARDEKDIARDLKKMAGLEPTPPPPGVAAAGSADLSPAYSVPDVALSAATEGDGPEDGDDALERRGPPRTQRNSSRVLGFLLLVGIAATLALWRYYPGFFTGHP